MLNEDDERDLDLDEEQEDADLDNENSDEEDDEDSDEGADDDDSSDDEDDDDKPVTRKELRELLKSKKNDSGAKRRIESKKRNNQGPKVDERISQIEQSLKKTELLEKKRSFGYENSLSPKQVDIVFRMTKRPTKKFLEEPYVKAALGAVAAASNVRENTPGNSGRNFKSTGGKTWDKLDANEKQESFADRRRSILESKKR